MPDIKNLSETPEAIDNEDIKLDVITVGDLKKVYKIKEI